MHQGVAEELRAWPCAGPTIGASVAIQRASTPTSPHDTRLPMDFTLPRDLEPLTDDDGLKQTAARHRN